MRALPVHPLLADILAAVCVTRHETAGDYRVLPDIYTVMGFQFSGRIYHSGENRALSPFGVTGILDCGRSFRSDASTHSLLLFFRPGGFYRVFGPVASAIGSASLDLGEVTPKSKDFTEILEAPGAFPVKWRKIQEKMLRLLNRDLSYETRHTLRILQSDGGNPRIGDVARELGISRRTLERRFAAEVGTPPKHLARIVRWRQTMKQLGRFSDFGTAALAHGYFDQAHFIRETQALGGSSPAKLKNLVFKARCRIYTMRFFRKT
ncbi:MAG: helix-turn-helix domain-containing protein [Turneriella sp.]|nr:helix-turn-helix domain-containing protein [Turneriella sp.]